MIDGKKFLFVGGCPRSGTTVLAKVLNTHRRIELGVERFNLQWAHETRREKRYKRFRIDGVKDVANWNRSLRATLDALKAGHDITVVPCEDLFASVETVNLLFTAPGRNPADVDRPALDRVLAEFDKTARGTRDKYDAVAKHVSLHAKHNLYRTLLNEHSLLREDAAGGSSSEEMVHA